MPSFTRTRPPPMTCGPNSQRIAPHPSGLKIRAPKKFSSSPCASLSFCDLCALCGIPASIRVHPWLRASPPTLPLPVFPLDHSTQFTTDLALLTQDAPKTWQNRRDPLGKPASSGSKSLSLSKSIPELPHSLPRRRLGNLRRALSPQTTGHQATQPDGLGWFEPGLWHSRFPNSLPRPLKSRG